MSHGVIEGPGPNHRYWATGCGPHAVGLPVPAEDESLVLVPVDVVPADLVGVVVIAPAEHLLYFVGQTVIVVRSIDGRPVLLDLSDSADGMAIGRNDRFLPVIVAECSLHSHRYFSLKEDNPKACDCWDCWPLLTRTPIRAVGHEMDCVGVVEPSQRSFDPKDARAMLACSSTILMAERARRISMVELESDGEMTRVEVARFLREFAREIDDGSLDGDQGGTVHREEFTEDDPAGPKRITLIVGGESATVTVPETVDFDIEIESRSPMLSSNVHQEIEFELSWEVENPDELDDDRIAVE